MTDQNREALRSLLRRVDEVRGLSDRSATSATVGLDDTGALVQTLGELVEELERSHRRLIETNVQLVSLREVAGSLTNTVDAAETTRTVTRYLQRAFGFDQVGLLLIDRERGVLCGAWTSGRGDQARTESLEVPLVGERGALARAVWLDRTLLHLDCRRHAPAFVAEHHPLHEIFERLGSLACVPLQRSQAAPGESGESCSERCVLGDSAFLAPPPGEAASRWLGEREEAQRRCLSCPRLPALGVIAAARAQGAPPLTPSDVTLLESIALSVAPMVENARLFQELRRSEQFQQHILDSMVSSLVAVNLRGEVLRWNRAATDLLGWSEQEVLGQIFGTLLGHEAESVIGAAIERGQEARRRETVLRARGGTPVPVSLTTSLLRDDGGTVYGAIATFLDLTPIKRAEEHARQMDRLAALGRFTSSIAHELRNPLTGIGMGVQHMARALQGDAAQRTNLEFILSEITRLDRIVQQLFDATHPRKLDTKARSLADTFRRAHQSLEPMLLDRSLHARFDIAPDLPPVPHDPDQIQQVFINLIKNAAEASQDGGAITLALQRVADGRATSHIPALVASVTDEGQGIDEETCRTLFEPFFTTKPGGTGLGLYITHDIVKRHGGSLTVQSTPGHGATFRVELPLESHGGAS